ncbi:MAG TPA: FAD-dependent oxidoreductase [Trebonia sp.]|nr:FAD-dependent oxidoreductase [Trebonia sp.]
MIDVLVVGGGPVGLATAICCARAGLSVTVTEPRTAPVDKACGEGVMPAAVRRLAALGVNPEGFPLRGIRYVDAAHQADARFRHGHGLGVRRTALHAALAARAAALGIPVLPVKVTAFAQDADHVTAAGVEARYLVAADGLHSMIRRTLERDSRTPGTPGQSRSSAARDRAPQRYGLRRHYRVAPWSDLVEVHWTPHAEAYVTPVSPDVVGVALLFAKPRPDRPSAAGHPAATWQEASDRAPDDESGDFKTRLSAFPALLDRLAGADPASELRGAGPMRQNVRRRVYGRVLLVGDASGYVDALTGEGLGVGLAQADALAACLAAGRPAAYERAWRRASGPAWRFTAGLLWSRNQPLLGERLVPFAQYFPRIFTTLVNHVAEA